MVPRIPAFLTIAVVLLVGAIVGWSFRGWPGGSRELSPRLPIKAPDAPIYAHGQGMPAMDSPDLTPAPLRSIERVIATVGPVLAPSEGVNAEGLGDVQAAGRVRGIVLDDRGAPVVGCHVSAMPEGDSALVARHVIRNLRTTSDGQFELTDLVPGSYRLQFKAMRHATPEPLRIVVPDQAGPFTIVTPRFAAVEGVVLLPDGRPAARAKLRVDVGGESDRTAETRGANKAGEFSLKSVAPRKVRLRAELAGYGSSEERVLDVGPGAAIGNVRLVLRTAGRIHANVVSADPGEQLSGRRIVAANSSGTSASGTTDHLGRLVFEDLAPGDYNIELFASPGEVRSFLGAAPDTTQIAGITRSLVRVASVTLEENREAHVTFGTREQPSIVVKGSVRRGQHPAAAVLVRASHAGTADTRGSFCTLTDAEGRFELAVLRAGRHRIEAIPRGSSSLPTSAEFDVSPMGLSDIVLSFPQGRIAGRVRVHGTAPKGGSTMMLTLSEGIALWCILEPTDWPDMAFEFQDLPAGSYSLGGGGWLPDASGKPGQTFPFSGQQVDLAEGQQLTDLVFDADIP